MGEGGEAGQRTEVGLDEAELAADPFVQFGGWRAEAVAAGLVEPDAMVLATAGADGRPSARTVLFKGVEAGGFLFFTNGESRKGRELAANPRAALVFLWTALARQVCITGDVEPVGDERSSAYFATRPRGSRLGAWASEQSRPLPDRAALEERLARVAERYAGRDDIPRPPAWGGYRVVPLTVEFWQGRPDRLHDRLVYRRDGATWAIQRLSP